ncbi:MAG TPA: hypothetical protein VM680_10235 [Verrucomicrobiae bacterium]|nr:hypothetical protein [Verrucomicrobiae bacterium]
MSNIVQIRQFLAEKFPGVRIGSEPAPVRDVPTWTTGLPALDEALSGGLPRAALTELCATENSWGSALVLRQLIRQTASTRQWIALVDGADSFDPGAFGNATLEHLLWLRCKNAAEAVKATDLILRDGNLPVIVLDLALNPARELRKIPSSTWYRFQRLVEEGAAAFLAITPTPMASSAKHRLFLQGQLPNDAFHLTETQLLQRLTIEPAESQREAIKPQARRA